MRDLFSQLLFLEEEYKDRHFLRNEFMGPPNVQHGRLVKVTDLFGGPESFEGKKVIEIGSQDGIFSMNFAQLGAEAFAVDIISKWLQYGKSIDLYGVHWIKAFAEYLPFSDHIFDDVFLGETLEHVIDPEIVLQEARRVAKEGARVVITVPWVAMLEPTHINEWPSFKWRAIYQKYISIISAEIFLERWFVVSGIV